jgi:hypothetical protein
MKKMLLIFGFFITGSLLMAQTIDRSQYRFFIPKIWKYRM